MVSTSTIIYAAHSLSAWGDRVWYFAIPLFLLDLNPTSLLLTAVYGLALSISVFLGVPVVGKWIDKTQRLKTMVVLLLIQNLGVVISALLLVAHREYTGGSNSTTTAINETLSFEDVAENAEEETTDVSMIVTYTAVIVLGSISMLASNGSKIAIQRDWIVVVSSGESDVLANLNAMMRRIDLLTKVLAPLVCGQIMTLTSLSFGALFICGWNIMSFFLEYYLLNLVYRRTPALSKDKTDPDESEHSETEETIALTKEQETPAKKNHAGYLSAFTDGYRLYFNQAILIVGVARSFMFLTTMGFGYVMIAFAQTQCISEFSIGIVSAGCAVSGILGTFLFPAFRKKVGLLKTGMIAGMYQSAAFIPAIISLFSPGSVFVAYPGAVDTMPSSENEVSIGIESLGNASYHSEQAAESYSLLVKCPPGLLPPVSFIAMILLFAAEITARSGLLGFDLTVTQLFQENIKESERGIVNGVQTSVQTLCQLIVYVTVMTLPKPHQFGFLVIMSAIAVTSGHVMYAKFAITAEQHYDKGGALKKALEDAKNNDQFESETSFSPLQQTQLEKDENGLNSRSEGAIVTDEKSPL